MYKLPNVVSGSIPCTEAQRKCAEMLYDVYVGTPGRFYVTHWRLNDDGTVTGEMAAIKYVIDRGGNWGVV